MYCILGPQFGSIPVAAFIRTKQLAIKVSDKLDTSHKVTKLKAIKNHRLKSYRIQASATG